MSGPKTLKELMKLPLRELSHRQLQELAGAIQEQCPTRTAERDAMGLIIVSEMWSADRFDTAIQGSWDANGAPL